MHDYDHAWRIVEAADHPALGTCLDSFHILSRGADPAGIREIPGEKVFYLQLADAPHLVMDVLQWSRHYRCFPGQGGFDLPAFLGHVLATGYDGPLSLEVFNDVFRQADPGRMAVDAMRSLLLLEERLPRRAAALSGYAFVELAVAPADAGGVERLLIAMGFRHAGQHRTKAVQLWRHGRHARSSSTTRPAPTGPRVGGDRGRERGPDRLGARAPSGCSPRCSRASAGRARPTCRRSRRPTARRCSSAAPTRADGWLGRLPDRRRRPAPARRDRPASTTSRSRSRSTTSTRRRSSTARCSACGSRTATSWPRPDGLVRSRAARSADGSVRFALSVPVVGSGAAEVQHVALASDDVFAAARGDARPRRAAARRSPATTTTTSPPARISTRRSIERMRALGILYDAPPGGGELLHFYTATAGPGLFFEVVERRGGYDGYGVANSPVRMAAQRGGCAAATPARRPGARAAGSRSPARSATTPSRPGTAPGRRA